MATLQYIAHEDANPRENQEDAWVAKKGRYAHERREEGRG
jgi:hypothetical protein